MKLKLKRKIDLHNATMIEFAYARTGSMLRAARVCAFVLSWGVVRRELGREPSVDEYAAYWKEARSTAFRHRDEFREVFGLDSPSPILDALQRSQDDRLDLGKLAVA